MRVVLVQPFGHHAGHPSGYSMYLSRALADEGAEVTMATYDGMRGDMAPDKRVKYVSALSVGGLHKLLPIWASRFLNFVKPLSPLVPLVETSSTFMLARRLSKRQSFNAIHILDASQSLTSFIMLANIIRKQTLVLTISHPPIEQYRDKSQKKSWRLLFNRQYILGKLETSKPVKALNSFMFRRAKTKNRLAFVTHSDHVRNAYTGQPFYHDIACIPWGTETQGDDGITKEAARQHLGLAQNSTILLSFGINHPRKDFEVIFKAARDLPKNFTFLFAGEVVVQDKQMNDPKRLAEEYGWADGTIIKAHHIEQQEMPYYFRAADVIILSYKREFVGASGILSHAAGFQLPVIASEVGQLGDFVRKFNLGLTFTPEDDVTLKQAISAFLILDEDAKQKMRDGLKAFSSAYSWGEVARKHLDLYKSPQHVKKNSDK